MADVFGTHRPKIPYRPIAELLALYAQRDPGKLAIVDLERDTSISYGELQTAVTDIAAALRGRGVGHGSRVLLLSDEGLEKLLIWLAVWRLGAVVAPLNVELNAGMIADLAVSVTGVAGPDGGTPEKPVGLVHFGGASRGGQRVHVEKRFGNPGRAEVRKRSVLQAFVMLHELAEKEPARTSPSW